MCRMPILICAISLILCAGCKTIQFRKFSFRAWAEECLSATSSFPTRYTRTIKLSNQIQHDFTLYLESSNAICLNCGNGLILKLKDPDYQNFWAEVTLTDVNSDGIDDLFFKTKATEYPEPVKAIFLFQDGKWEYYLLPTGF